MPRGGSRAGAGRKAGTKNDIRLRKFSVGEILDQTGTGPDKMPLSFLLAMMHAPEESGIKLSERIQCAIAAAPYCHPRLASVEVKSENKSAIDTASDLASALRQLAEIARLRERGTVIEGDLLEPSTAPDKVAAGQNDRVDIMTAGHNDRMDIVAASHTGGVDIMTAHTEGEEE